MRFVGRHDVPLLLGLAGALVLAVLNPLARVIEPPPDARWAPMALAIVPGVLLMALVLGSDRRRRLSADGVTSPAGSVGRAEERITDFDRLVGFHRALARVVDAAGLTAALRDHLAPLAGAPGVSVLLNRPSGWELYAGDGTTADDLLARAAAADEAISGGVTMLAGRDTAIPLRSAGQAIGLLVVQRPVASLDADTLPVLEAAAAHVAAMVTSLQTLRELHETNLRDPLTGCTSRAHGLEVIDGELRRARRSQQPISLVLVDIDHLKDINSRHGYACGDAVLAMVGRRLCDVLRRSDVKCRYGGEEFVVLLPETSLIGARRVAETLRREIADRPMPWNGDTITVTASLGVTQVLPGEVNADAIITRAEAAAARAQEEGHNTVRVASDSLTSLQRGRPGGPLGKA